MSKCPVCNHKLYGEKGKKRWCQFCGYNNDPDYVKIEQQKDEQQKDI
jgi:hypothetical protein